MKKPPWSTSTICPAEPFAGGDTITDACPVKTDGEQARLARYLPKIKA